MPRGGLASARNVGMKTSLLREIPSVDELLGRPELSALAAQVNRGYVAERVREVLEEVRAEIRSGTGGEHPLANLEARIAERVRNVLEPSLGTVINATGVILHTNLGRAPLAAEAVARVGEVAGSYSNLEYDQARGKRGKRDVHIARLLRQLLGAPAVVVNNNAAALLLVLNTLAEGGEVVVSRGELIEIGDSFRIPDVMAKSGAVRREVGTTNRTRLADYEAAIVPGRTRLLLRVHPSNYRIVGFTERPSLEELVGLGRRAGVPVFEDLGSGCLLDLRPFGITDEPLAGDSLKAGVDLVSFSGDKLLGGPQTGIIAGRQDLVEQVRRNPLFRALRVDKMTYAALEATLAIYLRGEINALPVMHMIHASSDEIATRARALVAGLPLPVELVPGESVVGGGSTPGQSLTTTLIALAHPTLSATEVEARLRASTPPVIARVEQDRVLLDLRTVLPDQDSPLRRALETLS